MLLRTATPHADRSWLRQPAPVARPAAPRAGPVLEQRRAPMQLSLFGRPAAAFTGHSRTD
jgi:hypothetical protein